MKSVYIAVAVNNKYVHNVVITFVRLLCFQAFMVYVGVVGELL